MGKVFGLHEVVLHPGVSAAEFERFVLKEFIPGVNQLPGYQVHLLKGDRGARAGHYLLLQDFDSVETRDRYFPTPGQMSAALCLLIAPLQVVLDEWARLATSPAYTDYVELDE